MIINVLKDGKYKHFRTITVLKDFIIIYGILLIACGVLWLCDAIVHWDLHHIKTIISYDLIGKILRGFIPLALFVSIYFNKHSHKDEIDSLEK